MHKAKWTQYVIYMHIYFYMHAYIYVFIYMYTHNNHNFYSQFLFNKVLMAQGQSFSQPTGIPIHVAYLQGIKIPWI